MSLAGFHRALGRCGCAAALITAVLLASGASARADTTPWCTAQAPPCLASATVDGATVLPTDPSYAFQVIPTTDRGSHTVLFDVNSPTSGESLGPAALSDVWSLVIDTGTIVPRVVSGYGANVTVTRMQQADGTYRVTYTGSPVTMADNDACDFSGEFPTCPYQATRDFVGVLSGEIDDYNLPSLYNATQVSSFYGMNETTNIDESAAQPLIEQDPSSGADELVFQLADQHLLADGSVFVGFLDMRIPNSFLQTVYGIDDPSTLTGGGVSVSLGSGTGTASVTEEPDGQAILVDVSGLTFTHRTVTIRRGVITPGPPTILSGLRTSATTARISFRAARPRGSRVTGYLAACTPRSGRRTVSATATRSPITIRGLAGGIAYRCTVRARSRAGQGPASTVRLRT